MTVTASAIAPTPHAELDTRIRHLRSKADEFARLPAVERARLLAELIPRVHAVGEEWVREACRRKGTDFDAPIAAEEWLAGPIITQRSLRLLHRTIDAIARTGQAPLGKVRTRPD